MFTDAKCSVGMWVLEKSEKNHHTEEEKVCSFPPDWTEIAIPMDFSCFRILINYSPSSREKIWFSLCYKSAGAQVSTVAVRGRERLKTLLLCPCSCTVSEEGSIENKPAKIRRAGLRGSARQALSCFLLSTRGTRETHKQGSVWRCYFGNAADEVNDFDSKRHFHPL